MVLLAVILLIRADSALATEQLMIIATEVVKKRRPPKFLRILKNILDGANMKASKKWKAGDSRTEVAAILNTFSGLIILGIKYIYIYIYIYSFLIKKLLILLVIFNYI